MNLSQASSSFYQLAFWCRELLKFHRMQTCEFTEETIKENIGSLSPVHETAAFDSKQTRILVDESSQVVTVDFTYKSFDGRKRGPIRHRIQYDWFRKGLCIGGFWYYLSLDNKVD